MTTLFAVWFPFVVVMACYYSVQCQMATNLNSHAGEQRKVKIVRDIVEIKNSLHESIELDFSVYDSKDEFYVTVLSEDGYALCDGRVSRDSGHTNLTCKGVNESKLRYGENIFFITIYSLKKKEIYSQKAKYYYYYPNYRMVDTLGRSLLLKSAEFGNKMRGSIMIPFVIVEQILQTVNFPYDYHARFKSVIIQLGFRDAINKFASSIKNTWIIVIEKVVLFVGKYSILSRKHELTPLRVNTLRNFFAGLQLFSTIPVPFLGNRVLQVTLGISLVIFLLWKSFSVENMEIGALSFGPSSSPPPGKKTPFNTTQRLFQPPISKHTSILKGLGPFFDPSREVSQQLKMHSAVKHTAIKTKTNLRFTQWFGSMRNCTTQRLVLCIGSIVLLILRHPRYIPCFASYETGDGKSNCGSLPFIQANVNTDISNDLIYVTEPMSVRKLFVGGLAIASQNIIRMMSGRSLSGFSL